MKRWHRLAARASLPRSRSRRISDGGIRLQSLFRRLIFRAVRSPARRRDPRRPAQHFAVGLLLSRLLTLLHGSVVRRRGLDGGPPPCHSKPTKTAVITSRSSSTE